MSSTQAPIVFTNNSILKSQYSFNCFIVLNVERKCTEMNMSHLGETEFFMLCVCNRYKILIKLDFFFLRGDYPRLKVGVCDILF